MSEEINPISEEDRTETAEVQPDLAAKITRPEIYTPPSDSFSYDEDADEGEEFDEAGDGEADRFVDGPANYVQPERGGRPRRIGSDVRVDEINYKNISVLSRFLDQRGRILSRRKTRVSAKVQRRVAREIRRARHMALLPFTGDHSRIVRKRR